MRAEERGAFGELLMGLLELYGRSLTPAAAALWWAAFEDHPFGEVRAAFSRYTQDPGQGRYPPTPAAVLGCLARAPETVRPDADEAWAVALEALDERRTVCTNDEIEEAMTAARVVAAGGDRIGARLAFRAAYERVVRSRRQAGRAPCWRLSLGWDRDERARVAEQAVQRGLLEHERVAAHLPPPAPRGAAAAVAGLLSGRAGAATACADDAETRQRLATLRAAIVAAGRTPPQPAPHAEQIAARRRAALAGLDRLMTGAGRGEGNHSPRPAPEEARG
ncbi:hypothetical protein L0E83_09855 [Marichromatium gracile]|uniref:hypothetical protein n=1 Tax=Marichromatium gracile TaxID=1048 RepID=UPI001F3D94C5|nr:hypothetical protein [Marichromatium gracile]MCF1183739.1 hypothetical protein [Marichromatium gracile]